MALHQQSDGTWVDDSGAPLNDFPGANGLTPEATPAQADAAGPAPGGDSNQIAGWYDKFLGPGRAAQSADPIQAWLGQVQAGNMTLEDVQNRIANSPEAQAYAAKNAAPAAAPPPAGTGAAGPGVGGGDFSNSPLLAPWTVPFTYQPFQSTATYKPPTLQDLYADPGYQARLEAGRQTMERGAASKGNLLTGGTVRDENQAAQDYASNEFGNVFSRNQANFGTMYNRDLTDWTTNYNKALQGYQQAYNIFSNNTANQFNRLAAVSGIGQTAAGQLGSSGLGYANAFANTSTGTANTIGNLYTQGGNANAAGTVGSANAWNQFYQGAGNSLQNLYSSSYGQPKQAGS